jgi:hypothetical protein
MSFSYLLSWRIGMGAQECGCGLQELTHGKVTPEHGGLSSASIVIVQRTAVQCEFNLEVLQAASFFEALINGRRHLDSCANAHLAPGDGNAFQPGGLQLKGGGVPKPGESLRIDLFPPTMPVHDQPFGTVWICASK